jgi:hypothetical protein
MLATARDLLVFLGAPLLTIQRAFGFSDEVELLFTLSDEGPIRIVGADGGIDLWTIACRLVSSSPQAVIMIAGTFGCSARTFGSISMPLMPGMLMSDRIRISDGSFSRGTSSALIHCDDGSVQG